MTPMTKKQTEQPTRPNASKLTKADVKEILRLLYKKGANMVHIAKLYGVSRSTIGDILHNRTWRQIKR